MLTFVMNIYSTFTCNTAMELLILPPFKALESRLFGEVARQRTKARPMSVISGFSYFLPHEPLSGLKTRNDSIQVLVSV